MSDRQLADIDISRNDIDAVVSGRFVRPEHHQVCS